jgi:hypothetical protein
MKQLSRLTGPAVMLGVCLALGYVVQDELGRDSGLAPVSLGAAPPPKLAVPNATPITAFSETLALPLFHASRKPAPKLATATPRRWIRRPSSWSAW